MRGPMTAVVLTPLLVGCVARVGPSDATDAAETSVAVDAPVLDDDGAAADAFAEAGSPRDNSCATAADCARGYACVFDPTAGCEARGVCVEVPDGSSCGIPPIQSCGCDGVTHYDECAGPQRPSRARGACPAGTDAASDGG